jgi:hypothetical protein
MAVFWDVAPCSLVEVGRCFRGANCLHHQGKLWSISTRLHNANGFLGHGGHPDWLPLFENVKDSQTTTTCRAVRTVLKDWFAASIRKLPERWQQCMGLSGEYAQCAEV